MPSSGERSKLMQSSPRRAPFALCNTTLTDVIARTALPVKGPALGADKYLELMRVDKKAEGGEIKYVLISPPGQAVVRAAPDALVAEVINACCA